MKKTDYISKVESNVGPYNCSFPTEGEATFHTMGAGFALGDYHGRRDVQEAILEYEALQPSEDVEASIVLQTTGKVPCEIGEIAVQGFKMMPLRQATSKEHRDWIIAHTSYQSMVTHRDGKPVDKNSD